MSTTIQCRDCPNPFDFSDGEAKFYQEKGYTPPVRCKPCREIQKARRQEQTAQAAISAPASPPPADFGTRKRVVVDVEEQGRRPPRKERGRRDTRVRPEYDD